MISAWHPQSGGSSGRFLLFGVDEADNSNDCFKQLFGLAFAVIRYDQLPLYPQEIWLMTARKSSSPSNSSQHGISGVHPPDNKRHQVDAQLSGGNNASIESAGQDLSTSQEDDDTRARLLAVAGPVFANQGYDRATVRQICRVAKVNLAAICYHFGDKMGLYMEVIRDVRRRRECHFPLPEDNHLDAEVRLKQRIRLLLSRMLKEDDERSWETQLLMREMQQPTAAFSEMVEQTFKPMMEQLCAILEELMVVDASLVERQRLAFSVIGQCLYYRVAKQTVRLLITEVERGDYFSIEALTEHITNVTLAATKIRTERL